MKAATYFAKLVTIFRKNKIITADAVAESLLCQRIFEYFIFMLALVRYFCKGIMIYSCKAIIKNILDKTFRKFIELAVKHIQGICKAHIIGTFEKYI